MRHALSVLLLTSSIQAGPPVAPDPTLAVADLKHEKTEQFSDIPDLNGATGLFISKKTFGMEERISVLLNETGADIVLG